jgi:predicted ATPase
MDLKKKIEKKELAYVKTKSYDELVILLKSVKSVLKGAEEAKKAVDEAKKKAEAETKKLEKKEPVKDAQKD